MESIVELNGQLYDKLEEVNKKRNIAQYQHQDQETELLKLKNLVDTTIRERDEAREQLLKLKRLLGKDCFQDQADNFQAENPASPPPLIDKLKWDVPDHHNRLEFPTKENGNCEKSEDLPVECLNLTEKQALYNQQHQQYENNIAFLDEHPEAPEGQQPRESSLLRLVEDPITGQDVWPQNSKTSKAIGMSETVPDARCFMGYPENYQQETEMGIIPLPPSMPLHLPAPPEADMQVVLSTLPEKGKFLEAVMQAGPLLQSLLISGSLPRWRHPPPSLDKVESPNLCLDSMPNPFDVDHMQIHATNQQDLYFPASNFHHSPNLVACTRNLPDFQHPAMYQAESCSSLTGPSSVNFKPIFTATATDCVTKGRTKVTKFRPPKNSYQDSHHALT